MPSCNEVLVRLRRNSRKMGKEVLLSPSRGSVKLKQKLRQAEAEAPSGRNRSFVRLKQRFYRIGTKLLWECRKGKSLHCRGSIGLEPNPCRSVKNLIHCFAHVFSSSRLAPYRSAKSIQNTTSLEADCFSALSTPSMLPQSARSITYHMARHTSLS